MKTSSTILIAIGALLLIVGASVMLFFSFRSTSSSGSESKSTYGALPVFKPASSFSSAPTTDKKTGAVTSASTFQVRLIDGSTMSTRDFTSTSNVTSSPDKQVFYLLSPIEETLPLEYEINYLAGDQTFVIILAQEPIAEVRRSAGDALTERLGISKQELCSLSVRVQVPRWVNSFYADKNLGFPGCLGSVKLSGD